MCAQEIDNVYYLQQKIAVYERKLSSFDNLNIVASKSESNLFSDRKKQIEDRLSELKQKLFKAKMVNQTMALPGKPQLPKPVKKKKSKKVERQMSKAAKRKARAENHPLLSYKKKPVPPLIKNNERVLIVDHEVFTVDWNDIAFEDGHIVIRVGIRKSLRYPHSPSRSSFKYLKPYIKRRNLKPLIVHTRLMRIIRIENLRVLNDAILLLEIKNEWIEGLNNDQKVSSFSIIDKLKKFTPESYNFYFKNRNRTPYLTELCNLHSLDFHHPVPVLEGLYINNRLQKESDSFLFTVRANGGIFMIWESVEKGKATYVFRATFENYSVDLQNIFDYISSAIRNVRSNLRKGVSRDIGTIDTHRIIYHKEFDAWKAKLNECFRGY